MSDVETRWKLWPFGDGFMVGDDHESPIAFRYEYEAKTVMGLLNALQAQADLAAGLRAKAELADGMATLLRKWRDGDFEMSMADLDKPLMPEAADWLDRFDALNPQPHHEETTDCTCALEELDTNRLQHLEGCPRYKILQPHHEGGEG